MRRKPIMGLVLQLYTLTSQKVQNSKRMLQRHSQSNSYVLTTIDYIKKHNKTNVNSIILYNTLSPRRSQKTRKHNESLRYIKTYSRENIICDKNKGVFSLIWVLSHTKYRKKRKSRPSRKRSNTTKQQPSISKYHIIL